MTNHDSQSSGNLFLCNAAASKCPQSLFWGHSLFFLPIWLTIKSAVALMDKGLTDWWQNPRSDIKISCTNAHVHVNRLLCLWLWVKEGRYGSVIGGETTLFCVHCCSFKQSWRTGLKRILNVTACKMYWMWEVQNTITSDEKLLLNTFTNQRQTNLASTPDETNHQRPPQALLTPKYFISLSENTPLLPSLQTCFLWIELSSVLR